MKIGRTHFPVWLLIMYLMALIVIAAWPLVAFGAIFAFDAPMTPAQTQSTEAVVGAVLAYPIIPLIGVLGSFFSWRAGRNRLAIGLAAFGLIPLVALILILLASSAMSALYALGVQF